MSVSPPAPSPPHTPSQAWRAARATRPSTWVTTTVLSLTAHGLLLLLPPCAPEPTRTAPPPVVVLRAPVAAAARPAPSVESPADLATEADLTASLGADLATRLGELLSDDLLVLAEWIALADAGSPTDQAAASRALDQLARTLYDAEPTALARLDLAPLLRAAVHLSADHPDAPAHVAAATHQQLAARLLGDDATGAVWAASLVCPPGASARDDGLTAASAPDVPTAGSVSSDAPSETMTGPASSLRIGANSGARPNTTVRPASAVRQRRDDAEPPVTPPPTSPPVSWREPPERFSWVHVEAAAATPHAGLDAAAVAAWDAAADRPGARPVEASIAGPRSPDRVAVEAKSWSPGRADAHPRPQDTRGAHTLAPPQEGEPTDAAEAPAATTPTPPAPEATQEAPPEAVTSTSEAAPAPSADDRPTAVAAAPNDAQADPNEAQDAAVDATSGDGGDEADADADIPNPSVDGRAGQTAQSGMIIVGATAARAGATARWAPPVDAARDWHPAAGRVLTRPQPTVVVPSIAPAPPILRRSPRVIRAPVSPPPIALVEVVVPPPPPPIDPYKPRYEDLVERLRAALGWGVNDAEEARAREAIEGTQGADAAPARSSLLSLLDVDATDPAVSARGTPLGRYLADAEQRVLDRWFAQPIDAERRALLPTTEIVVRFDVERNGRVSEPAIVRGTGDALLDHIALSAIPRRLPRFPKDLVLDHFSHQLTLRYRSTTSERPP